MFSNLCKTILNQALELAYGTKLKKNIIKLVINRVMVKK